MTGRHYTPPSQYKGEGEVWYQGERVATVQCMLGLFYEAAPVNSLPPVKGGSVQLAYGHIPSDGEELLLVCPEGRSLRFRATHKVGRVYRVTPLEQ